MSIKRSALGLLDPFVIHEFIEIGSAFVAWFRLGWLDLAGFWLGLALAGFRLPFNMILVGFDLILAFIH